MKRESGKTFPVTNLLKAALFNPQEPRDAHGRWATYNDKLDLWNIDLTLDEKRAFALWAGNYYDRIRAVDKGQKLLSTSDNGLWKNFGLALKTWVSVKDTIYGALKRAPLSPPRLLYRTLPETTKDRFTVGQEYELPALSSFTQSEKVAHKFLSGKHSTVISVDNGTGYDIRFINPAEHELLMKKGTRFTVTNIEHTSPRFSVVHMKQISNLSK